MFYSFILLFNLIPQSEFLYSLYYSSYKLVISHWPFFIYLRLSICFLSLKKPEKCSFTNISHVSVKDLLLQTYEYIKISSKTSSDHVEFKVRQCCSISCFYILHVLQCFFLEINHVFCSQLEKAGVCDVVYSELQQNMKVNIVTFLSCHKSP